ncbi:DUF551 domain-containing protein [Shigella sonnei]|nr:DUF551 domain-containing protein [Shigella sonnei]OYI69043.1 hypothetical protein CI685_17750 [Shigella sonnei]OYJ24715.1 hypothetical protein CI684_00955 [Shigella sonnei]
MTTITKERIELFIKNPLENGLTRGEQMELARIALVSLEQNALSGNSRLIPGEVLSAIREVAKIRADFDDFDGDRRGIGDCLDEAEQELIVTINKYASQLAAEPIATNDVREQQTAVPQVPVTPDGWISCSERMPNDKQYVWCWGKSYGWTEYDTFEGYYDWSRNKWWTVTDDGEEPASKVTHWMPLPEPPQEVNRG